MASGKLKGNDLEKYNRSVNAAKELDAKHGTYSFAGKVILTPDQAEEFVTLRQGSKIESVLQHRLCGESGPLGPWRGSWTDGEPGKNERYDAKNKYAKNGRTWFEFRRLTTIVSDEFTEEVEAR